MILLDTNIVSTILKNKEPAKSKHIARLENYDPNKIAISTITVSELYSGLYQIPESQKIFKSRIEKAISEFINTVNIIGFTKGDECKLGGEIFGKLKATGKTIQFADCLIAATAITNNMIMISNDKHFDYIGEILDMNDMFESWSDLL
jgi:tRNA(fMet)-specific endonuclease VapC